MPETYRRLRGRFSKVVTTYLYRRNESILRNLKISVEILFCYFSQFWISSFSINPFGIIKNKLEDQTGIGMFLCIVFQ
jgi:hypothetical protein